MKKNHLHILILTLLALLRVCFNATGQNLNGPWNGSINTGGNELLLVFHIEEDKCSLEVPAQAAIVPAEFRIENGSIKIDIPTIAAKFDGLFIVNSILGTFTQYGAEFPLTLKKGRPKPRRPQTPVGPFPYEIREVVFANEDASLAGTLTTPMDMSYDDPILLMVSGSGQQNRDEELMGHKPFAVIADAFARNGIATLRYDDRGVGASTGELINATTDTFATDAQAGLNYLRSIGYKKVGILGHSEGGTIAFMLAASKNGPDFIISLAGMAENGETTLLAQTEKIAMSQGLSETQAKQYAAQVLASTRAGANTWMKRFLELAPSQYLSKVLCPTLALNGEKDLQVISNRNIPIIRNFIPTATIKTYPDLNHLFQQCTSGDPSLYYSIEETISPEVLTDMIEWIKNIK